MPPRIDSILVLGTPSPSNPLPPPPVTRPTLSPLLLACLRYSSGRANLASFTYAAAAFPPGPMPFSPSTLDTSRDLNSFYFPYISRSTTPSCCHPPASSTSLPTASLHPAPPLVGPRTTLRPRTEASSDVTFIPPVPFLPPTLSPPSSCGSFELYSLSDIVTNVRPICGGCVRFPPSHPPDTRGRLGDECLGSREDPLDRGRIPEVKREGSVGVVERRIRVSLIVIRRDLLTPAAPGFDGALVARNHYPP